jgi:hypothetical protein
MKQSLMSLMAAVALAVAPAVAHHSVAGVFDVNDHFEIAGRIVEVEWVNPHVHIQVEVADDGGNTETWVLETAPTQFFRNAGVSKSMLEGDGGITTITGIRGLDKSQLIGFITRITYPDGRFIHVTDRYPKP